MICLRLSTRGSFDESRKVDIMEFGLDQAKKHSSLVLNGMALISADYSQCSTVQPHLCRSVQLPNLCLLSNKILNYSHYNNNQKDHAQSVQGIKDQVEKGS